MKYEHINLTFLSLTCSSQIISPSWYETISNAVKYYPDKM